MQQYSSPVIYYSPAYQDPHRQYNPQNKTEVHSPIKVSVIQPSNSQPQHYDPYDNHFYQENPYSTSGSNNSPYHLQSPNEYAENPYLK
jgi:hypothetical protein